MIVTLDECELEMALAVGRWRRLRVLRERLGRGHGEPGNGAWDRHINGAIGEMAVAKALGHFWGGAASDFGAAGDVGGYEVRATTYETGKLIVFEPDPPRRALILVVVGEMQARIAGWIRARDARHPDFVPPVGSLRPGSPRQWWVPQPCLYPFTRKSRAISAVGVGG